MMDTAIGLSRKIPQFPFLYVIPPFYKFAECSSNIHPSIKGTYLPSENNTIYLYIPTPSSILYYLQEKGLCVGKSS